MFTVKLAQSGDVFEAAPNETILDAAERAGVLMAHNCRSGTCRTCMTRVLAGIVEHDPDHSADLHIAPDEIADGYRLLCSAFARSDVVLDW